MTTRLAERIYDLIVVLHPRGFRKEYGAQMKLVFKEMLNDPDISRGRLWLTVARDVSQLTRGSWPGALFGCAVVLLWWITRSDVVPLDRDLALGLIVLLFVAAGFTGTLLSGSVAGGMSSGFVAGLISAVTVPGEYWLFGPFPFDVTATASMSAPVMVLSTAGAMLATFNWRSHRMRRGIHGFVGAWRDTPAP